MTVQPNPHKITIKKLDGSSQELFMSYALLNRLTTLIGGEQGLPYLASDPALQAPVLVEVFTVRNKGEAPVEVTLDDIEVDIETVGEVIDWVGGHVQHFLLQRAEKFVAMAEKAAPRISKLTATQNGLQGSTSQTPAASPSTASPQS